MTPMIKMMILAFFWFSALITVDSQSTTSTTPDPSTVIFCNDEVDCRHHCPFTHGVECKKVTRTCTCNYQPTIFCNDERECRRYCPYTHSGVCSTDSTCTCDPIPSSFFCNDDGDCRVHCPFTHQGTCQNLGTDNQTCTCDFHPTIFCNDERECIKYCPVTHRGVCTSNRTCTCNPIPDAVLDLLATTPSSATNPQSQAASSTTAPNPTTMAPAPTSMTTDRTTIHHGQFVCRNEIDCEVHCPVSHKGTCQGDFTCACDPHVDHSPITCQNTQDCIKHCLETHVGLCNSSDHTCRCLLG